LANDVINLSQIVCDQRFDGVEAHVNEGKLARARMLT
jgi:hypothetical protein